jgi:hypothetical protein
MLKMNLTAAAYKQWGGLFLSCILSMMPGMTGCRENTEDRTGAVKVAEVPHTSAKKQTIGNCWLYAQAAWLESLYKGARPDQGDINVSESYWLYWYFYDQLVLQDDSDQQGRSAAKQGKLMTEGQWEDSVEIIRKHGFMLEGDFLGHERDAEASQTQKHAAEELTRMVEKEKRFTEPQQRTPDNVRKVLNRIFGVDMDRIMAQQTAAGGPIKMPHSTWVRHTHQSVVTLTEALDGWESVRFPGGLSSSYTPDTLRQIERNKISVRLRLAINDHLPVQMKFRLDSRYLNRETATFENRIYSKWVPEMNIVQGIHQVVLADYAVKNIDAKRFGYDAGIISFGELDMKYQGEQRSSILNEAATRVFALEAVKFKNSWGSFLPHLGSENGYFFYNWDALAGQVPVGNMKGGETEYATVAIQFILPKE